MSKWGAIPSISAKRRARVAQYTRDRKWFLAEHPWCEWGLRQVPPVRIRSTEIHHQRGRVSRLLLDQRFWLAVSAQGHDWIHNNIKSARALGLICAKGLWNTTAPLSPPPADAERPTDTNPRPMTSGVGMSASPPLCGE